MDRLALEESESRFAAFVGSLNEVIGHRDRIGPFRSYCAGLLAGCERKSVEPLAAITAPSRVAAQQPGPNHAAVQPESERRCNHRTPDDEPAAV